MTARTGTDFGSDVTQATPPTTWDAQLTLLTPNLGTKSPYSIVTVPGVGTFWFTQDANVAWMSFNSSVPALIADKLFSNRNDILGTNNVNFAQIGQVRMKYHDRKLKLFLPMGSSAYSTVQYWLDIRQLQSIPSLADKAKLSWSGPHTGQSLSAMWNEDAGGDNNVLYATEGQSAVGMFIYLLNDSTTFNDVTGMTSAAVASDYRSFYSTFAGGNILGSTGGSTYQKWVPEVLFDASGYLQNATVTLKDLHGFSVGGLSILDNSGAVFSPNLYGNGVLYGNGAVYGSTKGNLIGHVSVESQSPNKSMQGDAIQVQVQHSGGQLIINNITPQVQIQRVMPVS